jgi:hypothetical protein
MSDLEKLPTIEPLQGIDSASESKHILSYDRRKTGVAFDQEIPNEHAFNHKFQTHLSEASDEGIRAWLAVFAQVQVHLIETVTDVFEL